MDNFRSYLALFIGVVTFLVTVSAYGFKGIILATVFVIVGLFVFIPLDWLPVLAVLATFFIPSDYLSLPHILVGVPFGIVPLAMWCARAPFQLRDSRLEVTNYRLPILGGFIVAISIFGALVSPYERSFGWLWLIVESVSLVAAILALLGYPFPVGLVLRTFRYLTLVTSVYAALEVWVFRRNVLFASLFAHTQVAERWNIYRATTFLGHPLVNSTLLVVGFALWLVETFRSEYLTRPAILTALSFLGVLATYSRSGMIASAVAALVCITGRFQREVAARRVLLAIFSALAAVFALGVLAPRLNSSEGQNSAGVRIAVPSRMAETLKGHELLGVGPGMSERYRSDFIVDPNPYTHLRNSQLENAYAETAIGLGYPNAVLFIFFIGGVFWRSRRSEHTTAGSAAFAAFATAVAGFNAFEGHLAMLMMLFVLAACAVQSEDDTPVSEPAPEPIRSDRFARGANLVKDPLVGRGHSVTQGS